MRKEAEVKAEVLRLVERSPLSIRESLWSDTTSGVVKP